MKTERDHRRYLIGIAACFALLPVCLAANNYVAISLPHGVQIELPGNWEALRKNQRITLDSAVQSSDGRAGKYDASTDLNFAGTFFDDAGKSAALVNVRYNPNSDISQADVRAAGPSDIRKLDSALRDAMAKGSQTNGFSVLEWHDTSKQVISGVTAFVTEYKRSPINNNGNFKVRLVRIFDGAKSFSLTVSYREDQEHLRPICDRIISSIRY
jgi:hypothetical protein